MPILPTYYKLSTELFRLGMYDLDTDTILIDEFRKNTSQRKAKSRSKQCGEKTSAAANSPASLLQ